MGSQRDHQRAVGEIAVRSADRKPPPSVQQYSLLALQRSVGNRAIGAALATGLRAPAGESATAPQMLALQRIIANRTTAVAPEARPAAAVDRDDAAQRPPITRRRAGVVGPLTRAGAPRATLRSLQRAGPEPDGEGAPASAPQARDDAGPGLQLEIDRQVAALPGLDEQAVPAAVQVDEARGEAARVGGELAELGLAGNEALSRFMAEQAGGGGEAAVPEARALERADPPVEAPPARPSLGSRIGGGLRSAASWLGSKAKSAGRAIGGAWASLKNAFRRENRRDVGAKAPLVGSIAAGATTQVGQVLGVVPGVVDNPATSGPAGALGGADQVHHAGSQVGQVANSAQEGARAGASSTLEHPAEFAKSFGSGGFELAHQIAAVVGIFFSGLKAALDIRSLVKSVSVVRSLKQAEERALSIGASRELVEAIRYAVHQKYEKIVKRAFGAATALAALGVGLAILIANPVGAALAATIIAGVGSAVFLYKLGRWAWKKWGSKNLGEKRKTMATLLYDRVRSGDPTALEATRSLHLEVVEVLATSKEQGIGMIMRKLKSA